MIIRKTKGETFVIFPNNYYVLVLLTLKYEKTKIIR